MTGLDELKSTDPRRRRPVMQPVRKVKGYLPIGNSRFYYETSGHGEPLLLLHGGFGTVEDFSAQTPELAKHFKVVAFERPGHGHTADNGERFSYASMSRDTVDFINALGLGATNLGGWSDGAIIAILVAISRPDLVKRLVSVSGCFNTDSLTANALAWVQVSHTRIFQER